MNSRNLIGALWLLIVGLFSFNSAAQEALFSPAESEKVSKVELFKFDSATQQARAIALAKELRCPQCQNQNLLESNSPIAQDLRLMVYQRVKAGESEFDIKQYMVKQYGEFVLYRPQVGENTLLLWLLPFLFVVLFIYSVYSSVRAGKNRDLGS